MNPENQKVKEVKDTSGGVTTISDYSSVALYLALTDYVLNVICIGM